MIAISLQSGSSGNCIYVEAGGVRLLFDAGISGVQAEKRLMMHGRDIRRVDALIISHDHTDHISCAGVFHRKFGIPVHMSKPTFNATSSSLGPMGKITHFTSGEALDFGAVAVRTLPTAHDAVDGSAFVVEAESQRLGILTDLGHAFEGLADEIDALDAVFLESNYDPRMLETAPYPEFVKARIKGASGHLSNQEAAGLLRDNGGNLRWACLAHLSENSNQPGVAMRCHHNALGDRFPVHALSRRECSEVFTI